MSLSFTYLVNIVRSNTSLGRDDPFVWRLFDSLKIGFKRYHPGDGVKQSFIFRN